MKKTCICITAALALCIALIFGIKHMMFLPQRYDDLRPVRELGLFPDLPTASGSCVYSVPASMRSSLLPFLRPMQSWYGEIVLSDAETDMLLHRFHWEEWSISGKEWAYGSAFGITPDHTNSFLFEFDELKSRLVGRHVLICRDFDVQQNGTHRIGDLFCFFDADARTVLFYYSSD